MIILQLAQLLLIYGNIFLTAQYILSYVAVSINLQ